MQREVLLLSIRPVFARRIFEGIKTVELRRVRPHVQPGQQVLIYSSSPTMALLGTAFIDRVHAAQPMALWKQVKEFAGVTKNEYAVYFRGAETAVAIWLRDAVQLKEPLSLSELRHRWPWFRPPQSYCFLKAHLDAPAGRVAALAPRG